MGRNRSDSWLGYHYFPIRYSTTNKTRYCKRWRIESENAATDWTERVWSSVKSNIKTYNNNVIVHNNMVIQKWGPQQLRPEICICRGAHEHIENGWKWDNIHWVTHTDSDNQLKYLRKKLYVWTKYSHQSILIRNLEKSFLNIFN